jgi:predicted regulator of Ras-like GTPase activity (Roadblock/LC7/MglB family)
MLQPRILPKIIEQANTDGVKTTLLLQSNGSLLASSGANSKEMDKLVAAIVSNVWSSYSKAGRSAFNNGFQPIATNEQEEEEEGMNSGEEEPMNDEQNHMKGQEEKQQSNEEAVVEKLNILLLDCEAGRLAITGVSPTVVLCLCAEKNVEFGLLRAKAITMRDYLAKPFSLLESGE